MNVQDELSVGERRLAAVILEMECNFSGFTAGEIATRAQVSNPTAARFFRRLGYESYQQAHTQARERAQMGSPLVALRSTERHEKINYDFTDYVRQENHNLSRTADDLGADKLERAVAMLRDARRIWIVGFRNSMIVGSYLHNILNLMREGAALLPRAGMTLGEDLVNAAENDLVVLLSFRRRRPVRGRIARVAQRRGAKVLQIGDFDAPPNDDGVNLTLRCAVEGRGIFDSYGAAMTLVNCLASLLEQSVGGAVASRLTQVESLMEEIDVLAFKS
ncbi:MurR/RpiR family transcriptional regulator [Acetobacter sacchari]|uniref:MurR/RpiR family transcriptional regulator n=1 Tax=Acetobacter sacchari TaxID=2661687 RepID=A0ABS3LXT0_9PROT|nr:MurR/RpiR family transcriptional regulator [Acetobacter sacchari]MBO1360711.1 MurR/RpiR family transcriptional regulator [Acetobacter sacchari]